MTDHGEMTGSRGFAYKPALDGLRAVAVLGVLLYHLGYGSAQGGFLGVDTFFVLSGYLITSLLLIEWKRSDTISLRDFWIRRARRLLPALLLVVLAIAIWAGVTLRSDQLTDIRGDGLATLFYSANWRFVFSGQSYFAQFGTASPFRHTWSLAIEEQFYLLWPLIVLACLRLDRGRVRLLSAVTVLGIGGSIAAMAALYVSSDPSRSYYGTDTRAHSLLIGVVLAIVLSRWTPKSAKTQQTIHVAGLVGLGLIIAAFVTISDKAMWMYRGGYALFAVTAMSVVATTVIPGRSPVAWLLSKQPFVAIGKVSYGLYLWHWPVFVALTEQRVGLSGAALDALRLGVTLAFTTASYFLVEHPIRRGALRGRAIKLATPIAIAGVSSALVIATLGASAAPPSVAEEVHRALNRVRPASTVPTTTAVPGGSTPPPATITHIAWGGDSVAGSLAPAVIAEGRKRGITITDVAAAGCGMVRGLPGADFKPVAWAQTCNDNIPGLQNRAAALKPEVVTWMSSWETADRIVDGNNLKFGTRRGDTLLLGLINEAVGRLTASGARVVFLTIPQATTSSDLPPPTRAENQTFSHLNALLKRYSRAHSARTSVVDVAKMVCPRLPCPAVVDGVKPRPHDGRHFSDQGPAWIAPKILDAILAAIRARP